MTLLDFPGRVACTVFLGGCDMRCPFCHNAELLDASAPAEMEEDALLQFLESRKGLLDGVAFTGGEPLLRKDLPELLRKIRDLGFATKIDTNGNHPDLLRVIAEEGLADYIAMDIKNSPARYAETIGVPGFSTEAVEESVRFLLSGPVDYEFRTTVIRELHDGASFEAIANWINGAKRYFLQPFVDRESVPFEGLSAPSEEDLHNYESLLRPYVDQVAIRGL